MHEHDQGGPHLLASRGITFSLLLYTYRNLSLYSTLQSKLFYERFFFVVKKRILDTQTKSTKRTTVRFYNHQTLHTNDIVWSFGEIFSYDIV